MKVDVSNIPTLIGLDPNMDKVIEELLKTPDDPKVIARMSRYTPVHLRFQTPTRIRGTGSLKAPEGGRYIRRPGREVTEYSFKNLFATSSGQLCYSTTSRARRGYPLYGIIECSFATEKVKTDKFSGYKEFRSKFDTFFITEKAINDLWNSKSSQHGDYYKPSDFRRLGKRGKQVMERFRVNFKGILNGGGDGYRQSEHGNYTVLQEWYDSWHHTGRDIKISHQTNCPYIFYSSEFHGCGNGRYGIIANKNTFLWMEDD